jgi:hypothetical protein
MNNGKLAGNELMSKISSRNGPIKATTKMEFYSSPANFAKFKGRTEHDSEEDG